MRTFPIRSLPTWLAVVALASTLACSRHEAPVAPSETSPPPVATPAPSPPPPAAPPAAPPPPPSMDPVPSAPIRTATENRRIEAHAPAKRELPKPLAQLRSQGYVSAPPDRLPPTRVEEDRDRFPEEPPSPVRTVADHPVSTFSVDVDTASYAVTRRFLEDGRLPPGDAVRVEELVHYFDYDYPVPDDRTAPFAVSATVAPCPWNPGARLLHLGLQGYEIVQQERPPLNLVFLLDVSGSMSSDDKLPLLQKSMRLLVDRLEGRDRVAIVVYAGAAGTVLEPTPGSRKHEILAALDRLRAGGSTAGGEGLRLAYSLAESTFDPEAVNRVILATDGDFNVGVTSDERLEGFVERHRAGGVYLSVLGFGQGNLNDAMMQRIAQAGNGNAAYIDSLLEARKVLWDEMSSTLFPIANDVKIQVQWNPARVAEYRLIGYETRSLRREDFSNDAVDAGEIGAGHEVTAIYEIVETGSPARRIEPSRYDVSPEADDERSGEWAFLRLRYKLPGETESRLIERPITADDEVVDLSRASGDVRWSIAVAAFGQRLRDEPYLGGFGYPQIRALAQTARGEDPFGYRAGFLQMIRLAEAVAVTDRVAGSGEGADDRPRTF